MSRRNWRGWRSTCLRPYGRDHSTLIANRIEALVASGDWDEADRASAAALRAITANYPHQLLISRAELETGRGDFDRHGRTSTPPPPPCARTRPWPPTTPSSPNSPSGSAGGRTPTRPSGTVWPGARPRDSAQIRVWLCAKGLRAAGGAGRARPRPPRRRRGPRPAHPSARAARDRPPRRRRGRSRHTERRRLARHSRGRVRSAPAASRGPSSGPAPPRRGSGSNDRHWRPTAVGARRRRSSPPAPPAPRQASRSARRTPSRPGSAQGPCCTARAACPARAARPRVA